MSTRQTGKLITTAATVLAAILLARSAMAYGPYMTPATAYIDPGDRIVLNEQVTVTAGSKIYLQNGSAKLRKEIQESKPYCYFHLYRSQALLNSAATVNADTFSVKSTANHFEFVLRHAEPLVLAGAGFITQDASQQTLITKLKLSSSSQPEVIGLNCGIWAVPNERNHLTLQEIKSALGDLVTLELNAED